MSVSSVMQEEQEGFLAKHGQKLVAGAFWVILLGGYAWYYITNDLTPQTALLQIVDLLDTPYGPLLYILIYALRPLIFFSAAALTIGAGAIFGASPAEASSFTVALNLTLAVVYTFVASLTSATVAYYIGRFFGKGVLKEAADDEDASLLQKYATRMRNNSFDTILIMRFMFLPYDLVNYLAGFLRIDLRAFLLATFLGSIPGTVAFVSFGASIDIAQLAEGAAPEFNPWVLGFGIVIFVVSIVISRYFKKKEAEQEATPITE